MTSIAVTSQGPSSSIAAEKKILSARFLEHLSERVNENDKILGMTRSAISIILNSGIRMSHTVSSILKGVVLQTKIGVIVNVPINLISIPGKIKEIWNNIEWKNKEGILLTATSFVLLVGSILDDFTLSVNAIAQAIFRTSIGWMNIIGAPLGIACAGISVFLKSGHLYRLSQFKQDLNRDVLAVIKDKECSAQQAQALLYSFVQKHLGISESSQAEAIATLKRRTNAATVEKMKEINAIVTDNETLTSDHIATIIHLLEETQSLLRDETMTESALLLASTVTGVACALLMTPVAPVAPLILLGVSAATQLTVILHNKHQARKKEKERI